MLELAKYSNDFKARTGMDITFDYYPEASLFPKLQLVLSSGSSDYDVFAANNRFIGQISSGNWEEPLTAFIKDPKRTDPKDFADFVPSVVQSMMVNDHNLAYPWGAESNILYYNKKMFVDAGLKGPPLTLEELMLAAQKLNRPELGQYGIALRATREAAANGVSWIFIWLLMGGKWVVPDKQPYCIFDTDVALKATEYWYEILKYSPPGISSYGWPEAQLAFQQGKVAMFDDVTSFGPWMEDPTQSTVVGNVGYYSITGKGTIASNWAWWIPKGAKNKEASYEAIKWLSSVETLTKLVEKKIKSDIPRTSILKSDLFAKSFNKDWSVATQKALLTGNIEFTPLVAQGSQIRDILAIALSKILSNQISAKNGMLEAQAAVTKLMKESTTTTAK
jgi:ABC-type glycerol-3-phosphate transport system substrate-binding protein